MAEDKSNTQNLDEVNLRQYVIEKDSELESDYSDRVNGVVNSTGKGKKIAGYLYLRRFYEGDQWQTLREDGGPMGVFNYCRSIVTNYTAFLSHEEPEFDVPPRDVTDDIETARAEGVENIINEILEDNQFAIQFTEAAQNQSLLGECFIFGPYIEWIQIGEKKVPRIRFKNVKRIENIRIFWSDEDFEEMDGFIFYYRVSVKKAEQIFAEQMRARGIEHLYTDEPWRYIKDTQYQMVTVKIYWDESHMLSMVGDKVIDFIKHDWGFIPGIFVKNMSHPTRPWGVSDIEDILDAQVEYNETASDTRAKIKQVAAPKIFYSGEGAPVILDSQGMMQLIKLGAEDKLWPDPVGQSTAPFDGYLMARKQDIHGLSMISEIFFGGPTTAKATGRALSVLMQGVNQKIKLKQQRWKIALKTLVSNILHLVEVYYPESKQLIQGRYKVDVFFPAVLIRNITEEINKFNMKIQSLTTTQKNVGIPSPKEEQKIMKKEWDDMPLAIEISRNPQLHMQLQQILNNAVAQTLQQKTSGGPMLSEGENIEGGQPMPAEGTNVQSPTSPEGAANLIQSRQ